MADSPAAGSPGISRWAVASLLCSVAFLAWPVTSLLAVIFGVLALNQIGRTPGMRGVGMAVAGIAIGSVILVLVALALIVLVIFGIGCRNGC